MSNLSQNQKSFTQLTRYGMPQFRAIRRPMHFAGEVTDVGVVVSDTLQATPGRLRQFYDQRLIEPIPETIPLPPPLGRPASEASIPSVVLEQQAMEAGEVEDNGVFADVVLGIDMPVEIEDIAPPVPVPVSQQRSRRNR